MSSERPSVLVVDDSPLVRRVIADLLVASGEFRLAGEAADGMDAIRKVHALSPDLVTLDVVMPGLDGLQALGYIMSETPRPVVMLTAAEDPRGGDLTLRALELGAVDFVRKPAPDEGLAPGALAGRLLEALRGARRVNLGAAGVLARPVSASRRAAPVPAAATRVVAIAASTGGPRALAELIPALPPELGAAVIVAQHMPAGFTRSLADRLDRRSALPVTEAAHGEPLHENRVYVAPGGRHLCLADDGRSLAVLDGAPLLGVHPSADLLLGSVARHFARAAVGVILTGMGRDGAEGLRRLRAVGGRGVVQDEATCTVYGMPRAALREAGSDVVAPLGGLAEAIVTTLASMGPRPLVTRAEFPRS